MEKRKKSLKERWSTFFDLILDPWIIILIVCIVSLIVVSTSLNVESSIRSILTVLISIISSLLGGIFAKRWSDINEEQIIVARGKSAIRSLKLLILNIVQIEKRVKIYIERLRQENSDFELIKNQLEEVIEKCNILEEESINSIENWTDIIPEANIKTQVGILSDLKADKVGLQTEIKNLKIKIKENQEIGEQEKADLKNIINDKEKKLIEVQSNLWNKESELNTSVLSGLTLSTGVDFSNVQLKPRCVECGKEINSYPLYDTETGEITYDSKCPECNKK